MKRLLTATAAMTLVLLVAVQPAEAGARVRIDRVHYDSPGSDHGSNESLNGEWVRLKNFGNRKINIQGWSLSDAADHVYTFGRRILKPGKVVYVQTGSGRDAGSRRYWGEDSYVWNNDADTAKLRNLAGKLVDRCSWSGSSEAASC